MGKFSFMDSVTVSAGGSATITYTNEYAGKTIKLRKVCVAIDDTAVYTVTAQVFVGLKQIAPTNGKFVSVGSPRPICFDTDAEVSPNNTVKVIITNNDSDDHNAALILEGDISD